jgi:hypothetical protein
MGATRNTLLFDKKNKSNYGAVSEEATTAASNDADRNAKTATPKHLNAYHTVEIDARRKKKNRAAEIPKASSTRHKKVLPKGHVKKKLSDVDQDSSSSDEDESSTLEKGEAPMKLWVRYFGDFYS